MSMAYWCRILYYYEAICQVIPGESNMISEIMEHQTLEMNNVLHYHGWVTQQQANEVFVKAEELMNKCQAKKNGYVVTATRAVEMKDGQAMMDLDVFIPLDKEIETRDGFDFIKRSKIENALKIRIEGELQQAETAMQKLNDYIISHSLTPTTPACMVTVKGATTPLELNNMITDIYVGVMNN